MIQLVANRLEEVDGQDEEAQSHLTAPNDDEQVDSDEEVEVEVEAPASLNASPDQEEVKSEDNTEVEHVTEELPRDHESASTGWKVN